MFVITLNILQIITKMNPYSDNYIKRCVATSEPVDESFVMFLNDVEQIVYDNSQLYLQDFTDEDYYRFYSDNCTPQEVAELVLHQLFEYAPYCM